MSQSIDSIVEVLAIQFRKGQVEDWEYLDEEFMAWESAGAPEDPDMLEMSVLEMSVDNVPKDSNVKSIHHAKHPQVIFNRDLIGFSFRAVGESNDFSIGSGVEFDADGIGWETVLEDHIKLLTEYAKKVFHERNHVTPELTLIREITVVRFLTVWHYWSTHSHTSDGEEWDAGSDLLGRFHMKDLSGILIKENNIE